MNKDNKNNSAEEARNQNAEHEPIISLEVELDTTRNNDLDDLDEEEPRNETPAAEEESSKADDDDEYIIKIKTSTLAGFIGVMVAIGLIWWVGSMIIPPVYDFISDYFCRHILNQVDDVYYRLFDSDLWLTIPVSLFAACLACTPVLDRKVNFWSVSLLVIYFALCVGIVEFWDYTLCDKLYYDYDDFEYMPAISRTLVGWMDAISCAIFFIVIPILSICKGNNEASERRTAIEEAFDE